MVKDDFEDDSSEDHTGEHNGAGELFPPEGYKMDPMMTRAVMTLMIVVISRC